MGPPGIFRWTATVLVAGPVSGLAVGSLLVNIFWHPVFCMRDGKYVIDPLRAKDVEGPI
jgi:hypothetical protein